MQILHIGNTTESSEPAEWRYFEEKRNPKLSIPDYTNQTLPNDML